MNRKRREKGPGTRAGNNNVLWYLKRNGPTARQELPYDPGVDARRLYDLRSLDPAINGSRTTKSVMYLGEYHDRETVLRVWVESNLNQMARVNIQQVSLALPTEFQDVWRRLSDESWLRDILKEPSNPSGGGGGQYTTSENQPCPKCGTTDYPRNLPHHLRHECDGEGGDSA